MMVSGINHQWLSARGNRSTQTKYNILNINYLNRTILRYRENTSQKLQQL